MRAHYLRYAKVKTILSDKLMLELGTNYTAKKSDFRFVKITVLLSVIIFSKISAKEMLFVHSIMVFVCNMTFIKSTIRIIE